MMKMMKMMMMMMMMMMMKMMMTEHVTLQTHTWKSAVDRMCLPSGLHRTATSPASPSSILHVQSGFSSDQTYILKYKFSFCSPFQLL